jgi:hypothetical protein
LDSKELWVWGDFGDGVFGVEILYLHLSKKQVYLSIQKDSR